MMPDLKKNPDGSLTLYIQKDLPGANKELEPAPRAKRLDLSSHASLLAKARAAVDRAPGEGTWKPPAIVKAQ